MFSVLALNVAVPVPAWPMRATAKPGAALMLICELATVSVPVPSALLGVPPTFKLAPDVPRFVMSTTLPLLIDATPVPLRLPIDNAAQTECPSPAGLTK